MPTYDYSGYRSNGQSCRGTLDAENTQHATRLLAEQGIFVEALRPLRPNAPLSTSQRACIYRELGALLQAGLPLERALQLMMESEDTQLTRTLTLVLSHIREGRWLGDSLAEAATSLKGYERAVLTAAEHAATLPSLLPRLADLLESQEQIRDRVRSALVYPTFVLVLGILVASVMLGVVVPKTSAMLTQSGFELPLASRLAVSGAKGIALGIGGVLLVGGLLGWILHKQTQQNPARAIAINRILLRLPCCQAARHLAGMRFASTLSVLTTSGMAIVEALKIAAESMGSPWLAHCVSQQADAVRHGKSLSEALLDVPFIGHDLGDWVRVGEAGGCLAAMLDVAAQRLERTWERTLNRRLALLEPTLLASVGAFVLILALALILPILSMTQTLGAH